MTVVEYHNLTIVRQTKGRIPPLPFVDVKEAILGKGYELSLVFLDQVTSISLHHSFKGKADPVNVLSFTLEKNEGEILITLTKARTEAKHYGRSYHNHLLFLFIHGCLHLKGMDHGDKMEKYEQLFYKRFTKPDRIV